MAIVYSNLKFLNYVNHLKAIHEKRIVAPIHVRLKPINNCNHDCWYCAYRVNNLQLGENIDYLDVIPEKKMFEIVEDIIEMKVKAVTFSGGGEPLLYKPLPDVIQKLAENGVRIASLTNGSNLRGKIADAFAKYGTWVRVSTDAWDDTSFAQSRNIRKGEFSQLLENMENFASRGSKCTLGVSFVVDKNNHQHLYEACRMFKKIGVNHVKFSAVVVSNSGDENNAYHRDISKSVTQQIAQAQILEDGRFSIVNHYHEMDVRFQKKYLQCPYLMFLTVIGADQKVYSCQDKAFTTLGMLGDIKHRRFKDFWFSEENRTRVFELNPSLQCQHHCVSHAKNLAIHDLMSIDPEHGPFV